MNQRIQELAKDCGYQHKPLTALNEVSDFEYFDLEKFAELIVRECADIADFCDQVESVEAVSSVLKRHFEIKGDEREQVLGLGEDS